MGWQWVDEDTASALTSAMEAELDARGQRPIPWDPDADKQHIAAKFWHSIDGTLEAWSDVTELKGLDCDEYPCLGLVVLPSDGLLFDAEIQGVLDQRFRNDRPRVVPLDEGHVLSFIPEQPMRTLSPRERAAVERRIAKWTTELTP